MKNVMKKIFGQKGFSLPEVLIAVGLMGGMSLLVSQVVKQTDQVKKTSETNTNTFATLYQIQALLQDPESCRISLAGLSSGDNVPSLKSKDKISPFTEKVRFVPGNNYEGGSIRLTSITLTRNGSETLVNVEIQKIGNKKENGLNPATVKKSIPVNAEYDTGNHILSCQSDVRNHSQAAVTEALQKICSGLNLSYDAATRRCFTKPQIGTAPVRLCPANTTLVAFRLDSSGEYVTECQDTVGMHGTCNDNQLLRKDGVKSYSCVDISCGNSGVFLGLDSNGAAQCRTCNPGETLSFVAGQVVCRELKCPPAHYMVGIDSNGSAVCNALVDTASSTECANGALVVKNGSLVYQCCTAECGDRNLQCNGVAYQSTNSCGMCSGTGPALCTNGADHCSGTSYPAGNGCGVCQGTRPPTNASWGPWSACTNGTRTRTCDNLQACGGAGCIGDSIEACTSEPVGKCTGYGSDSTLFTISSVNEVQNGCRTQYRDVFMDINVSKFKVGNIYSVGQGGSFTAEVLSGDTPAQVLQRIADKINAANMTYPTLCNGAGSTVVTRATVISANRMQYHINWQHQPAISGTRSCNIAAKADCEAAVGCNWDTTSANLCYGGNYLKKVGTCNGSYSRPACVWNGTSMDPGYGSSGYSGGGYSSGYSGGYSGGSSGGSNEACTYGYYDQTECNSTEARNKGCYWGSKTEQCYAGSQTECQAQSGCSWKPSPDEHKSCTATSWESGCKVDGAGKCTWGPRE